MGFCCPPNIGSAAPSCSCHNKMPLIKYIREKYRAIGFFPWTYTNTYSPENVYVDAKYEEKNLTPLGKCVKYEARSEKREKGPLIDKLYYLAKSMNS